MPIYSYRASSSDGAVQAGSISADNQDQAAQALQERGFQVLMLKEKRLSAAAGSFSFLNRVTARDVVVISRTLSVMVSASVPLVDAVRNIASQTENPRLRAAMIHISGEVEGGARLSDALEQHPEIFSAYYVNMIRSGETSGQLDEVMEYLADQMEKDFDLNAKIKGAMIYPAFILSGLIVVAFIMMTFVVPKLTSILEEANVPLPFSTRMLILVSGFFQGYWWLVIILAVLAGLGFRSWITTPGGRMLWDRIKMRIPIFGGLLQRIYVVRFARSLTTLTKGGVDVISGLEIVSGVVGNVAWKHLIFETIREVNDGNSITTAMRRSWFVPSMLTQMLEVGEGTGKLREVLERSSHFFSREIDNLVANLVSLIEPIVMVLLGIGVGVMVSAILLPLYSLSSATG